MLIRNRQLIKKKNFSANTHPTKIKLQQELQKFFGASREQISIEYLLKVIFEGL